MKDSCVCFVQDEVRQFELQAQESCVTALISEDALAGRLLQGMAGLRKLKHGVIEYPCIPHKKKDMSRWVQYVPDDIICYRNLKVKDYLRGMAYAVSRETAGEAERLCELFGIDVSTNFLEMTFEQNRLVAMIQALARKPRLLLLDKPSDMLGKRAYLMLWREIFKQQQEGMAVVLVSECYEDIGIPCDRYLFFEKDEKPLSFSQGTLPHPAKVITLEGGTPASMNPDKLKIISRGLNKVRFLYWEEDARDIASRICESGCYDFSVEELSMEEEITQNYEGWML